VPSGSVSTPEKLNANRGVDHLRPGVHFLPAETATGSYGEGSAAVQVRKRGGLHQKSHLFREVCSRLERGKGTRKKLRVERWSGRCTSAREGFTAEKKKKTEESNLFRRKKTVPWEMRRGGKRTDENIRGAMEDAAAATSGCFRCRTELGFPYEEKGEKNIPRKRGGKPVREQLRKERLARIAQLGGVKGDLAESGTLERTVQSCEKKTQLGPANRRTEKEKKGPGA